MKHYFTGETDALELLLSRGLPENVILHCQAVADTSGAMAEALNKNGFSLDVRLCVRGGLLHDIERLKKNHEHAGADLLRELGMNDEADIVEHHMGLGIDYNAVSEREVVFLADKITQEHHRTTVSERYAPALRMTEHLPEVHREIENVVKNCVTMESVYEALIGCSLMELPIGKYEE
jgi:putative nucleotidyltransferase with HDIG domain